MLQLTSLFLSLTIVLISCANPRRVLPELDLRVLENSQGLSQELILDSLRQVSIHNSFEMFAGYDFFPVMVCGIPCKLSATGRMDSLGSVKRLHTFYLSCTYEFVQGFADSVFESGDPYVRDFSSRTAIQDSLVSRLKSKYGDWDKYITEGSYSVLSPEVRLRTIYPIIRKGSNYQGSDQPDTSTKFILRDSAYSAERILK